MPKLNVKTTGERAEPAGEWSAPRKWLVWAGFAALILSTAHLLARVDFINWPVWLWRAKIYFRRGHGEIIPEEAGTPRWHLPPPGRA